MKVLSFGSKKYTYLSQLYGGLKRHHSDLSVDYLALKDRSGKSVTDENVFDGIVEKRITRKTIVYLLLELPRLLLGVIYSIGVFLLAPHDGIRSLGFVISAFFKISLIQHAVDAYAVIHVHYCTARNMAGIFFLPRKACVVCTYWGSDLFRHQGIAYNFWSGKALRRVDAIIVSSPEMRETLLSEFGRDLKPKVRYAMFIPEFKLIGLMDGARGRPDNIMKLKTRLDIPDRSITVCVGNNASSGNNHLAILSQFEKYTADLESVYFVLPLTYGRKTEYCRKLDEYCKKSHLHIRMVNEFMSWEDLALLRMGSDIVIMMPESDAMSAALAESMYAGSVVVTGDWLPYGCFRNIGCFFKSVLDFEDLPETVNEIIADIDHYKQAASVNKDCLRDVYYNEELLAKAWLDAYAFAMSS